jgi:hypothetical protein
VTHQTEQREVRRLDRTACHRIGVEACALQFERKPVVAEIPGEHSALVTVMDEDAADPSRVGVRADEHILPAELPLGCRSGPVTSLVARPRFCRCHREHHG